MHKSVKTSEVISLLFNFQIPGGPNLFGPGPGPGPGPIGLCGIKPGGALPSSVLGPMGGPPGGIPIIGIPGGGPCIIPSGGKPTINNVHIMHTRISRKKLKNLSSQ